MKIGSKEIKKIIAFVKKNYILAFFCFIIFIVGIVVVFRLFTQKKETIYVKVKVSQGLWWASTLKPSVWLATSLQKGDKEISLSGDKIAEIIEVRRYPLGVFNYASEQYDVFLIVKMKVGYNENTGKYTFKRSNITIGGPVEYEFQNVAITGTVVDISNQPIQNKYEEKTVVLEKELAQQWEYDAIMVGDSYFDGEDVVLEIIDKEITDSGESLYPFGIGYPIFSSKRINMRITAMMKLKKENNTYIFREEYPVTTGRRMSIFLEDSGVNDVFIVSIH